MTSQPVTPLIYARMKGDIITCALKPGSFHTEMGLAQQYGVSKTPIRLALSLLQAEGLLSVLPRRGVHICPVDIADLRSVYTLRGLLEPFAAALAATNRTDEHIATLRLKLDVVHGNGNTAIDPSQIRAHTEFHVEIARATGMKQLWMQIRTLHESMERFFYATPHLGAHLRFGDLDNQLLSAIERADPHTAESLARESIATSVELTSRAILATPASKNGSVQTNGW